MRDVPWKYARLILFFLVGVIAAMRLCTYYEPNDRDIGCDDGRDGVAIGMLALIRVDSANCFEKPYTACFSVF